MIPQYEAKFWYLVRRQHGGCAIARSHGLSAPITELHHYRIHDTAPNRRRWPRLIHSLWNLAGVNRDWHLAWPSWGKASAREADRREEFLRWHPRACLYLNMITDGRLHDRLLRTEVHDDQIWIGPQPVRK